MFFCTHKETTIELGAKNMINRIRFDYLSKDRKSYALSHLSEWQVFINHIYYSCCAYFHNNGEQWFSIIVIHSGIRYSCHCR